MINAITAFNACISDVQNMRIFYIYLKDHCKIPNDDLTDLLRSELVNIVSAMDRFIHEVVRIGIINTYLGISSQTDKCKTIPVSFATMNKVLECRLIEKPTCNEEIADYWINKEIVSILKTMSFQKISKIKDALSYIWDVSYKIPAIISKMQYVFPGTTDNEKQRYLEEKIDLIVSRRNQIVHEADYDISTLSKQAIDIDWLDDTILFIKEFTYSIYENITADTAFTRL